jgi:hypothetical protein
MPVARYWNGSTWIDIPGLGAIGGQIWTQQIGDGAATSFTVTHNLNTRNVTVSVYRTASPFDEVECDVERTDLNTVTIRTYPTVPALGELTVLIATGGTQTLQAVTMDPWHTVGNPGEPAFQNAWVNFDPSEQPLSFRKFPDGKVVVRGIIKNGSFAVACVTLPVGYRPPKTVRFSVTANSGSNACDVRSDGTIVLTQQTGGNAYDDLSVIEFDTESALQTASVTAQPMDSWHLVGATGEPTFQNGWVNYDNQAAVPGTATQRNTGFRKYPDGRVRLKGVIRSGTGVVVFTLPPGYRPVAVQSLDFAIPCSAGLAQVTVSASGTVAVGAIGASTPATFSFLDAVEFDTESVAAYSSGVIGPTLVAALPANPVDGQECYFIADVANGVIWHLRYRAASSSAYKWEVVGGPPLYSRVDTGEQTASTSWVDLATVGPSITVPLAGDYDLDWGAYISTGVVPTGVPSAQMGISLNAGAPAAPTAYFNTGQQYAGTSVATQSRNTGIPVGGLLRAKYIIQNATQYYFALRFLRARPVRVG